ncbi:conserved hypothetical protein [Ricinus communis]|uniref:Uncharacterized protein n=1 Tax=Ricinus communis TaxID=3988 RepID=B9SP32_RICCO|nr:conserved hypothetical protein [Ricinus communis]
MVKLLRTGGVTSIGVGGDLYHHGSQDLPLPLLLWFQLRFHWIWPQFEEGTVTISDAI